MGTIRPITCEGNAGGELPVTDADAVRLLGMTGRRWANQRCASPSARYALLVSRTDPTDTPAVRWPCDRWACAGCRRRKLVIYGVWYARRLLAADGPLFLTSYEPGEWDSLRKDRSRNGAEWVRVGEAGGAGRVFGAYPRGTKHRGTLKGAGAEQVIPKLGRSLGTLRVPDDGERLRLVDASKGWRMPDLPPAWRLAGLLPTGEVDDIMAAADRLGLPHTDPDARGRVSIRLTPGVGVDDLGAAAAGEYHRRHLERPGKGGSDTT